jgi:hypothetical protein
MWVYKLKKLKNKIMSSTLTTYPMQEKVTYETPLTRHERLRNRIQKYCLPDQADKVMLTILAEVQGYDAPDTHRNTTSIMAELAASTLGIQIP